MKFIFHPLLAGLVFAAWFGSSACAAQNEVQNAATWHFDFAQTRSANRSVREFDGQSQTAPLPRAMGASMNRFALELVLKINSRERGTLLGSFDTGQSQGVSVDLNTNENDTFSAGSTRLFLRDLPATNGAVQNAISATFSREDGDLYDGKFHHLLFVYDGAQPSQIGALRVFVDGAPVSLSFAPNFVGVPRRFDDFGVAPTLGARNNRGALGNFAKVTLDEIRFSTRFPAAQEVEKRVRAAGIEPVKRLLPKLDALRVNNHADKAAFAKRASTWLRFVVENRDNPMQTVWGKYRDFDGYALACLTQNRDEDARRLMMETLDMIDQNFADERKPNGDKWHLADFAMEPLLRAYFGYRPTHFPNDPVWQRVEKTAQNFLFHYGDLSENHNLLHLSLRYLTAQTWPNATFNDGRNGKAHLLEAEAQIRAWMNDWVRRGSTEWGADIYYNINLLALLNLYDFAREPGMKIAAQGMLDLFALDEALDSTLR